MTELLKNPVVVAVLTAIVLGAGTWLIDVNTTDSEVAPIERIVEKHEQRIGIQEDVSAQLAQGVDRQTTQTAFISQKFASDDITRLKKKGRENWDEDDEKDYADAERRLEYSQDIIDKALGLGGDP